MKAIYWRWKKKESKTIAKDYIQADLGNMLELADSDFFTNYPTRVLKKEIEIFSPKRKD